MTSIKENSKIAAIQMCSAPSAQENLTFAKHAISEAAKNGAELIVLPEMFAVMGASIETVLSLKEKMGEGHIQRFLSNEAKMNKVWIVGGTIPISSEHSPKMRAACLLINDHGECVARYDKIHLFDVSLSDAEFYRESDTTEAGETIVVVDTPFGKIGLAVCYDLRFPELFRCMFNQGADMICIPTAFTETTGKAHWEILMRARAIENFYYLVGACQGGLHANGRKTYGHSMIVEPWGSVISEKMDNIPGIIYADIHSINYFS